MMRDSYTSMRENLKDYMDRIKAFIDDDEFPYIHSGFQELDDIIDCFEKGKVYVIGSRPCMGKEEFMLSMIIDIIIESKLPTLLFSTNHMKSDYILRLLTICRDIHSLDVPLGLLDFNEWERLDSGVSILADAPLFMHDSLDLPIDELLETVRNCCMENGIRIIFIDCLQMIDFANEDENASERIAKVMYALKQLACLYEVPVVVGSMLGRGVEYREGIEGKQPQLMDLANSSYIEGLADVIMMVHRPEYYHIYQDENGRDLHGRIEVIVRKNALKPLGSIFLDYHENTGVVCMKNNKTASKLVKLKDLNTDNEAVKNLIKTFDLKEVLPF